MYNTNMLGAHLRSQLGDRFVRAVAMARHCRLISSAFFCLTIGACGGCDQGSAAHRKLDAASTNSTGVGDVKPSSSPGDGDRIDQPDRVRATALVIVEDSSIRVIGRNRLRESRRGPIPELWSSESDPSDRSFESIGFSTLYRWPFPHHDVGLPGEMIVIVMKGLALLDPEHARSLGVRLEERTTV